ncbi:MAG: hypothetical protein QXV50_07190 [Fervidicoccaceae archaeon]
MMAKVLLVKDYINSSFGLQATVLEKGLRELGYEVSTMDKMSANKRNVPSGYDYYIFYTVFGSRLFWSGLPRYGKNVVFEVSDTDQLSGLANSFLNREPIDVIVTPSRWSKAGFTNVRKNVVVIPHALDPEIFDQDFKPDPSVSHDFPFLFCSAPHSPDRKGVDIISYVIRRLPSVDYLIEIMDNKIKEVEGLNTTGGVLSKQTHYTLFSQADILLYPARGGAFEIPIIESLAFHADVIVPEQGPWTEYVDPEDAIFVNVNGRRKYWFTNVYHVGNFIEPDKEDAYRKTVLALSIQDEERTKMKMERGKKYRERFHYLRIAKFWDKLLSSL